MKLLIVWIYVGILLFLADLSFGKKTNENAAIVEERKNEKPDIFIRSKSKKHSSKNDDTENDDDDDDERKEDYVDSQDGNEEMKPIYVCGKKRSESICNCTKEVLDCHKQLINGKRINHAYVKIRDGDFVVTKADFTRNMIHIVKKGFIIPNNVETLKYLLLWENQIHTIENNAFDAFDKLESIDLRKNLLTDIDENVLTKKLGKTLQALDLNHNKLKTFSPTTFGYLHNLKSLFISANPIIELNKDMFPEALANLESLHLGSCNITTLDDDIFENLKNLRELILMGNPLTSVPKALNAIPHLGTLDLSVTLIESVITNAFNKDSNLSHISFFEMPKLAVINDCAFCGLPNLKWIGLWNCKKLSHIHENAFGSLTNEKLPQIKQLYISTTNITVFPEKLLNWEAVKEFAIARNNPLACDCSMAWLINDLSLYKMFSPGIPTCASPPELVNVSFTTVSGTICIDNTIPDSNGVFWPTILFVAVLIGIIAFLCYTYRPQKVIRLDLSQMTYRNLSSQQQHRDDEEELQAHF